MNIDKRIFTYLTLLEEKDGYKLPNLTLFNDGSGHFSYLNYNLKYSDMETFQTLDELETIIDDYLSEP